jgi:anti-anti-sigma factor
MMEPQAEIGLETVGDVTLFNIKGDVTALSEPFLNDAYSKANEQGAAKILLKLKEDAYINSGGIALLIQILAETQKNKQQTGITGLSDHFKKIFNMVGITKFAKIYNTLDDALEAMSGPS